MKYEYYSKWRECWIEFNPTDGQLFEMKKYFYEVRQKLF